MVALPIPELRGLIVRRLGQMYSPAASERMAEIILFGDLIGRPTHGIARILPGTRGAMDEPGGEQMTVSRLGPASASVEGRPGMLVADVATDLVIELADRTPAVVTTRGSISTSGSLTYYLERLADAGIVGMVVTNTVAIVTVPGGKGPVLGTNPIAFGIPSTGLPFIFDMGTSAVTGGDVLGAIARGEALPPDVALDADGSPTTDPDDVFGGGGLLPFGGHKGLGLSMFVEMLAGVLAGASAAPSVDDDGAGGWGHVFVGIPLAAVGDPDEVRARTDAMISRLLAHPTADGAAVRIPGHRSLGRRDAARASGMVDVDESTLARLRELVGS